MEYFYYKLIYEIDHEDYQLILNIYFESILLSLKEQI